MPRTCAALHAAGESFSAGRWRVAWRTVPPHAARGLQPVHVGSSRRFRRSSCTSSFPSSSSPPHASSSARPGTPLPSSSSPPHASSSARPGTPRVPPRLVRRTPCRPPRARARRVSLARARQARGGAGDRGALCDAPHSHRRGRPHTTPTNHRREPPHCHPQRPQAAWLRAQVASVVSRGSHPPPPPYSCPYPSPYCTHSPSLEQVKCSPPRASSSPSSPTPVPPAPTLRAPPPCSPRSSGAPPLPPPFCSPYHTPYCSLAHGARSAPSLFRPSLVGPQRALSARHGGRGRGREIAARRQVDAGVGFARAGGAALQRAGSHPPPPYCCPYPSPYCTHSPSLEQAVTVAAVQARPRSPPAPLSAAPVPRAAEATAAFHQPPPPPPPLPTVAPAHVPTVHSLLLPLPMSLLYTHSLPTVAPAHVPTVH